MSASSKDSRSEVDREGQGASGTLIFQDIQPRPKVQGSFLPPATENPQFF